MSLDNVIAVAGAAHGSLALLLFGLAVSIPLIVWSSQLILHWMERWPVIILLGAGLLGYVAGQMIFTDPGVLGLLPELPKWIDKAAGAVGAVMVVAVGRWLEQRILARQDVTIV
jgi:predicted tellurium resistance membrane protein TerC